MFHSVDKPNTQYTGFQKFIFLILFPLFEIKDISHYDGSALYQLFKCCKDVFTVLLTTPIFPGEDLRIGLIFD
jgi:hypothetical protein